MFLVSAFSVCKIKVFGRNASVPKHFVNQTIGAQVVLCTVSCWCLSVSVSVCVCQCLPDRERQIETQTDTQTETQTDTPTDRRTDTHRRTPEIDTQTHGNRLTERHTDEDTQTLARWRFTACCVPECVFVCMCMCVCVLRVRRYLWRVVLLSHSCFVLLPCSVVFGQPCICTARMHDLSVGPLHVCFAPDMST